MTLHQCLRDGNLRPFVAKSSVKIGKTTVQEEVDHLFDLLDIDVLAIADSRQTHQAKSQFWYAINCACDI